ncbi:MAG: translation initiation factor [Vulcanimicrobiaceae bacterium]
MPDERRLVYSTDGSLPLPDLRKPKPKPNAKAAKGSGLPADGVVRVGCERRSGGWVTLVHGLAESELASVAKELKRRCGTGGTAKSGVVELQGDRRDAVIEYLMQQGRTSKRMGGP